MGLIKKFKKYWIDIIAVVFGLASILTSFWPPMLGYTFTSFLVSIFIFNIDQYLKIKKSVDSSNNHSSVMSDNVKDRLHVIRLQEPTETFNSYIIQRLSIIKSIKNTSFNISGDSSEADEYFNSSDELANAPQIIAPEIAEGLKWRDVGDKMAQARFANWNNTFVKTLKNSNNNGSYESRILNNRVPYPNFLIITYKENNRREVLFNWDYRSAGHIPKVLVSSEKELVDFYNAQFELLFKNATKDSDLI